MSNKISLKMNKGKIITHGKFSDNILSIVGFVFLNDEYHFRRTKNCKGTPPTYDVVGPFGTVGTIDLLTNRQRDLNRIEEKLNICNSI